MPQIGPLEIAAVALLALVVFGPQKLPGMARSAGKALNELRRAAAEVKREVDSGLREEDSDDSTHAQPETSSREEDPGDSSRAQPERSNGSEAA